MRKAEEIHGDNLLKELKDTFSTSFKQRKEERKKQRQMKEKTKRGEREKERKKGKKKIYIIYIYMRDIY